ncbi:MAG: class II aldolase/adducin family protein [Deltaproteobacteria bacterium]|nr:class II aldolase/adducin family protein [Deltaproteobacteria bacterium]
MKYFSAPYLKKIKEMQHSCSIAFNKNLIDTHSGNISYGDTASNEMIITKTGASLINLEIKDFTIAPIEINKIGINKISYLTEEESPSSEIAVHRFILKSFPNSCILHTHPETAIALSIKDNYKFRENKYIYNLEDFNNIYRDKSKSANEYENKKNIFENSKKIETGEKEVYKNTAALNLTNNDIILNNLNTISGLFKIYPELKILKPADFEAAYFFPSIYIFPLSFIEDIKSNNKNNIKFKTGGIFADNGIFIVKSHGCFAWGKTALDALRWTMMLESSSRILYMLED